MGDARLISSPTTTLAKIAPGRNSKSRTSWLKTDTPVMSLGRRSGVNCTRRTRQSIERARVLARSVLPTPGTSSTRRFPSARSTVMAVRTTDCLPSITEFIAAASEAEICSTWSSEAPRAEAESSLFGRMRRSFSRSLTGGPFSSEYPPNGRSVSSVPTILPQRTGLRRRADDNHLILRSLDTSTASPASRDAGPLAASTPTLPHSPPRPPPPTRRPGASAARGPTAAGLRCSRGSVAPSTTRLMPHFAPLHLTCSDEESYRGLGGDFHSHQALVE